MLIRDAEPADLPAILAIHNDAVLHSTAIWSIHPVDLANRAAVLAERRQKGHAFLVAVEGDALMGYASFGDFRPHDGFFRTVEHSIYVHADHRRKGVARALLPPLMAAATAAGKHVMIGGIDATNAGSVALHEAFGFQTVGLLPQVGFKFGRPLDLLFMQKILGSEAEPAFSG
ncbi:GNAT family N-acetyltransferase [Lichenihabitans sp. Uapishka_5]|uniref:GNAT family N-acetyltransferase n=1 Tax=Lichenihabitans sp. Uapishka_5 TaxID=3037302 RepID=UPI0029E7EDB8|nr:GNAT family N-acetyltransferase [Lichenihabitans sp. Uapishka_5]MDX7950418.1 GNAT family N-acetyltransferase [Lichenihabitans sp. Uapishka_5]